MLTYHLLQTSTNSFCKTFSSPSSCSSPNQIIQTHFTKRHQISVHEHGSPSLTTSLPFLGKSFFGPKGLTEYFELLGKHVTYEKMEFRGFVIDVEAARVSCRGQATFTWISTQQSWDECFAWIFDFDEDGLITDWNIWGDTYAVLSASRGELPSLEKKEDGDKLKKDETEIADTEKK